MWLLDTNVWIHFLNSSSLMIESRLSELPHNQIFLCDVVKAELYYGAYRSQRVEQNSLLLEDLFSTFISLPFDGPAAHIAGRLRAQLADQGTPIGPYDLQIAAIALAHNLILVSHNQSEFQRVPSLQIEDWEMN